MTKSQNTKNEQLTEQWKKGKLPDGDYFITNGYEIYPDYYDSAEGFLKTYDYGVQQVLAAVPSFDELQNMNKAVNECMAANIKLVEENKQLKEQINHLLKTQARQFVDNQKLQVKAEKAKDVVNIDTARQIKQLKELLKECKTPLKVYNEMFGNKEELLTKIDEALK